MKYNSYRIPTNYQNVNQHNHREAPRLEQPEVVGNEYTESYRIITHRMNQLMRSGEYYSDSAEPIPATDWNIGTKKG